MGCNFHKQPAKRPGVGCGHLAPAPQPLLKSSIDHRHRPAAPRRISAGAIVSAPCPIRARGRRGERGVERAVGRPGSLGELAGALEWQPALQVQRGRSRSPSSSASPRVGALSRHLSRHLSRRARPPRLATSLASSLVCSGRLGSLPGLGAPTEPRAPCGVVRSPGVVRRASPAVEVRSLAISSSASG